MGLSIAQLPPLLPLTPIAANENNNTTDFKVFSEKQSTVDAFVVVAAPTAKPISVAKADSIDYFLADVMPTGAFKFSI